MIIYPLMRHIRKVTCPKCHVFSAASLQLLLRSWERRGCQSKGTPLDEKTAVTDFGRTDCMQSYRPSKCPRSLCTKTLELIAFMRLVSYTIFGVWSHFCVVTFPWNTLILKASMPVQLAKRSNQHYFSEFQIFRFCGKSNLPGQPL